MKAWMKAGYEMLRALPRRIGTEEKWALMILLILLLAAGAFSIFFNLAGEVWEGETQTFDEAMLLAFRAAGDLSDPIGPPWVEEMMRDFTALGSLGVLTALTLIVIGFLILVKKTHVAWLVGGATGGGVLMSQLLKWGFDRPRPDLVPHGMAVYTQSFPSGHAMLSAIVFLTLGTLLVRTQSNVLIKIYLLSVAAFLTVIVGISRIYLGVHWPTDVLAGWAVGIAWALLCWLIMVWLQTRGKVEPETDVVASDSA